ncbi:MAG: hypothetical protein ACOCXJ_05170, partial [Planctomycetota bacterium]
MSTAALIESIEAAGRAAQRQDAAALSRNLDSWFRNSPAVDDLARQLMRASDDLDPTAARAQLLEGSRVVLLHLVDGYRQDLARVLADVTDGIDQAVALRQTIGTAAGASAEGLGRFRHQLEALDQAARRIRNFQQYLDQVFGDDAALRSAV